MLHKFILLSIGFFILGSYAVAQNGGGPILEPGYKKVSTSQSWTRSLFLKLPDDGEQSIKILNAHLAALTFAYLADDSLNNLGQKSNAGALSPETFSQRGLRALSSEDLYMSRMVTGKNGFEETFKAHTTFKFIGAYFPIQALKNNSIQSVGRYINDPGIQTVFNRVAPLFDSNIRLVEPEVTCSQDFINTVRLGLAERIKHNFRNYTLMDDGIPAYNRAEFLMRSFEPILISGNTFIDTRKSLNERLKSFETRKVYFSLPGQPILQDANGNSLDPRNWSLKPIDMQLPDKQKIVSDWATFDHVSLGANLQNQSFNGSNNLDMMMFETSKKYSERDSLHLLVKFGKLSINKPFVKSCELAPFDFSDPESGVVLRGRLQKPLPSGAGIWATIINKITNGVINRFQIRLTINRLALDLKRKPSANFEEAFDDDNSFEGKNIKTDATQTVMHVTLFTVVNHAINTPTERFLQKARSFMRAIDIFGIKEKTDNWVLEILHNQTGFKCFDEDFVRPGALTGDTVCSLELKSLDALRDNANFILKFVNEKVMSIVQAQAGMSIDSQIPTALDNIDNAIPGTIGLLMKQAANAKDSLVKLLSTLPQNSERVDP